MQKQDSIKIHGIGTVTRRTGLTSHAIRAWERRYEAVSPQRSDGNQRLYSDADVHRLLLLKKATEEGMSISKAVGLDEAALQGFIRDERLTSTEVPPGVGQPSGTIEEHVSAAIQCVYDLNHSRLAEILQNATVEHGLATVLNQMIGDLATAVGDRWRAGQMRIFHEHLASVIVRSYLQKIIDNQAVSDKALVFVATTPAGQLHEIGALLCAAVAKTEGLRSVYLGPNTPAEEIIKLSRDSGARYVALSLYYPTQDRQVVDEIRMVRSGLPEETILVLGGPAAEWYKSQLSEAGIELVQNMIELRDVIMRG